VTTLRPGRWDTPLGSFIFHHIKVDFLRGYRRLGVGNGQQAFFLEPGADAGLLTFENVARLLK